MLREPGSVEWIERHQWPVVKEGSVYTVTATYRARNGFGGVNVEMTSCRTIGGRTVSLD